MADLRIPELNCYHGAGRIASDITSRTFESRGQMTLCEFTLAASRHIGQGEQRKEETAWLRVKAWGSVAEYVINKMRKGDPVLVEARVSTEEWTDKEGRKQSKTVFVARTVSPLSWPDKGDKPEPKQQTQPTQQTQRQSPQAASAPVDEDDIPF